jgi:hypothetical protein
MRLSTFPWLTAIVKSYGSILARSDLQTVALPICDESPAAQRCHSPNDYPLSPDARFCIANAPSANIYRMPNQIRLCLR